MLSVALLCAVLSAAWCSFGLGAQASRFGV